MPLPLSIDAWLNRLLPRVCLLCGDRATGALCAECEADLPRLAGPLCPVCAQPLEAPAPACGACLKQPPAFDACFTPLQYAPPADALVRLFKFPGEPFARRLASADCLAAAMLGGPRPAGDVIVPVPLSRARLKERGFNQALELARPLARALMLPLDTTGLVRVRETAPQSTLAWEERARNLRQAFLAERSYAGLSVILVDDVMTTGATFDAAASALKAAGAVRVFGWSATRALKAGPP
ncbi:MAG: ComF family protein [Rhodocyclaceae bacterium]|nr:ComF family protein [Rhodocyclaceae bacterium]